jgi:RimJ/RimL family protein N-acetyltransferase
VIDLPVTTERLVIDRLTRDDRPALVGYRNDARTAQFQAWPLPYTLEAAAALASSGQVALRADGELAGDAMVRPFAGSEHDVELGITLAPSARGRGLATEAVTALTDALFGAGRVKVAAYVDVRNGPSLRLFDRLGFRREGLVHHGFKGRDGLVDEVLFGLSADLWRKPTTELEVEAAPHPADIASLDRQISEFNVRAVGLRDGTELAAFERDVLGRIVGGVAGVAWAGGAELRLLWVQADRRGAGLGRRLVRAFEDAARAHVEQKVFFSTHSFQAPGFYEHLGYVVTGRWEDWPNGHAQVFLAKPL